MDGTHADSPAGRSGRGGWWQCRAVDADGVLRRLAVVAVGAHADGEVVELPLDRAAAAVGDAAVCTAHLDDDGRVRRLVAGPMAAPGVAALWFTVHRETASRPPAMTLIAFDGLGVAAGSVLEPAELDRTVVGPDDQVGAVRWWPGTGEVDQIYVQPAWRRRGVGSELIAAAAAFSYASGWVRLWGDGQRTELGESFRNASPWRSRAQKLTHLAPAMTPGTPA